MRKPLCRRYYKKLVERSEENQIVKCSPTCPLHHPPEVTQPIPKNSIDHLAFVTVEHPSNASSTNVYQLKMHQFSTEFAIELAKA